MEISKNPAEITRKGKLYKGHYRDLFSNSDISFHKDEPIVLQPWDFRVYEKNR